MKRLLLKMGFIKLSIEDFGENIVGLTSKLSDMIFEGVDLEKTELDKAKSEFKIFLWIYVFPVLEKNLSPENFQKSIRIFQNKIIFQDVEYLNFNDIFKEELISSRLKIHDEGIESLVKGSHLNYFRLLDLLWFKEPYYVFGADSNVFPIDFDPIRSAKINLHLSGIFKNLLPHYVGFIAKYSKKVK